MKNMDTASIVRFAAALLGMLQLVASGYGFEIGQETVDATVDLISGALVVWSMWKNTYLGKKGAEQKKKLEAEGLK